MSLLRRRNMMENVGSDEMKEWRLLKKLVVSGQAEAKDIVVDKDENGQPFSVSEIYIRIKSIERAYAYTSFAVVHRNNAIGEIRGATPCEVFIKNVGGFWRMFYMPYAQNETYSQGTLFSYGGMHYPMTVDAFPAITSLIIIMTKNIDAEIYAR